VLVPDTEIVHARQALWDHRRIAVEHGAATALAALLAPDQHAADRDLPARPTKPSRSYRPGSGEKVCVVLCGANTDTRTLTQP
jgi:threonine dehydratase